MSERRFPPPWTVETIPGGLKVCDANGQSLAYVYSRENSNDAHMAKVLTEDEARRIASNIAKLPTLLAKRNEVGFGPGLRGTNITLHKDSRVVPFIHTWSRDTCFRIIPGFIDPVWPRETSPLSGLLYLARVFALHSDAQDTLGAGKL
jgi:hypothetical protein